MFDRGLIHPSGPTGMGERGVAASQAARTSDPMGGTGTRESGEVDGMHDGAAVHRHSNGRHERGRDDGCEGPVYGPSGTDA